MKFLPITNLDLEKATELFTSKPTIKIWRLKVDRYVITRSKRHVPVVAFDSTAFSSLIDNFSSQVVDIKVIRGRDLVHKHSEFDFEVRISLEDGRSYYFSSDETAIEASDILFAGRDECPAPTPCRHWDLPEEAPNEHMFITHQLANEINEMSSMIRVTDIVDRLWLEASLAKSPESIGHATDIEGEFLDYTIKELRCGRIVYMQPNEASTYTSSNR